MSEETQTEPTPEELEDELFNCLLVRAEQTRNIANFVANSLTEIERICEYDEYPCDDLWQIADHLFKQLGTNIAPELSSPISNFCMAAYYNLALHPTSQKRYPYLPRPKIQEEDRDGLLWLIESLRGIEAEAKKCADGLLCLETINDKAIRIRVVSLDKAAQTKRILSRLYVMKKHNSPERETNDEDQ